MEHETKINNKKKKIEEKDEGLAYLHVSLSRKTKCIIAAAEEREVAMISVYSALENTYRN